MTESYWNSFLFWCFNSTNWKLGQMHSVKTTNLTKNNEKNRNCFSEIINKYSFCFIPSSINFIENFLPKEALTILESMNHSINHFI